MSLRFTPAAAAELRAAIRDAQGVEVFAIGDVVDGEVKALTVTCRGQMDRVIALLDRPRAGQVVIHNHPSGELTPSHADLELGHLYGEDGVGMVIVDSAVTRSNWVVEPHAPKPVPIDREAIVRFFEEGLKARIPDAEPRAAQLAMALDVATCLDEERPLAVEAGTGTGKSLAYLVPAALWAVANDGKVVISTYTKALQAQLEAKDLPLLAELGLDLRYAVLQGRTNYLCKRRLGLALDDANDEDRPFLEQLAAWESTSADGSRGDLPDGVPGGLWERVESDTDLTLSLRCTHYQTCHYYQARRRAAAAHLVVVNHALLLADLALRDAGAQGVLPKYRRVILDEAHHLEDAATGATSARVTLQAIRRAVAPLLGRRGRPGALERVVAEHAKAGSALPPEAWGELERHAAAAKEDVGLLRAEAGAVLEELASSALDAHGHPRRVRQEDEDTPWWTDLVRPVAARLASRLEEASGALDRVLIPFDDLPLPSGRAQGVLDARRSRRRLLGHAAVIRAFLEEVDNRCRWIEPDRSRGDVHAAFVVAPIDLDRVLRAMLWEPLPGAAATSATLAVGGKFEPWLHRVGLRDATTVVHPSPFDHASQALLGLPRDLPVPDAPEFLEATGRVILAAIRHSGGGAFVLCTSYDAVRAYAGFLSRALPAAIPVFMQDGAGRNALLRRFREHPNAVLVGTDSFWEGVSVKGPGLRLVIIPRLPFRVPTDPLQQARHERIQQHGGDPFRAYTLPQAILKLRQGYGRLIRHRDDRGVVLLLDRRLHDRPYGRIILGALPPARRIVGPWQRVSEEVAAFYRR